MTQDSGLVVKRIAARCYEVRYDSRLLATVPYGEALPIITGRVGAAELLMRFC